jgi:hypothetical protein
MEGKDFGLPGPDGAGQPGQLRDPDAVCPAVEAVQGGAGRRRTDRSIDGAQQLLALPGGRHLTARVTDSKPSPQPRPSSLGELLGKTAHIAMRSAVVPSYWIWSGPPWLTCGGQIG